MPNKDYFKNDEERRLYYRLYRKKNLEKRREYNRVWMSAYRTGKNTRRAVRKIKIKVGNLSIKPYWELEKDNYGKEKAKI